MIKSSMNKTDVEIYLETILLSGHKQYSKTKLGRGKKKVIILAYTGATRLDDWKHSYKQTNVWPSQMTKTCKLTSNISN